MRPKFFILGSEPLAPVCVSLWRSQHLCTRVRFCASPRPLSSSGVNRLLRCAPQNERPEQTYLVSHLPPAFRCTGKSRCRSPRANIPCEHVASLRLRRQPVSSWLRWPGMPERGVNCRQGAAGASEDRWAPVATSMCVSVLCAPIVPAYALYQAQV